MNFYIEFVYGSAINWKLFYIFFLEFSKKFLRIFQNYNSSLNDVGRPNWHFLLCFHVFTHLIKIHRPAWETCDGVRT